jgi:hypothetical protein
MCLILFCLTVESTIKVKIGYNPGDDSKVCNYAKDDANTPTKGLRRSRSLRSVNAHDVEDAKNELDELRAQV